jgi:hypothetical protein
VTVLNKDFEEVRRLRAELGRVTPALERETRAATDSLRLYNKLREKVKGLFTWHDFDDEVRLADALTREADKVHRRSRLPVDATAHQGAIRTAVIDSLRGAANRARLRAERIASLLPPRVIAADADED